MLYVSNAKKCKTSSIYLLIIECVFLYTKLLFFFLQNYQKLLIRLKYCPFHKIHDSNIKKSEQTNQIDYF